MGGVSNLPSRLRRQIISEGELFGTLHRLGTQDSKRRPVVAYPPNGGGQGAPNSIIMN